MGAIYKYLGDKKFLMGDKVTYCDFILYELMFHFIGIYKDKFKSTFPKFLTLVSNFEELPKIKEYLKSDRVIKVPFMAPGMAAWTGL